GFFWHLLPEAILLVCACIFFLAGTWVPKREDRKSTRLNSSHLVTSYAVFCLKKKNYRTPRAEAEGVDDRAGEAKEFRGVPNSDRGEPREMAMVVDAERLLNFGIKIFL